MKRLLAVCVAAFVCGSLALLGASAQKKRAAKRDCYETAMSQHAMNQCAAQEFEKADAELNRVYRQLLEQNKEDKLFVEKLTLSERAWVAFRDAEMEALYPETENPLGTYGSVYPMCYGRAKARLTRERTAQLRAMLDRQEGDVCR